MSPGFLSRRDMSIGSLETAEGKGIGEKVARAPRSAYLFIPMNNIYRTGEAVWGNVTEA